MAGHNLLKQYVLFVGLKTERKSAQVLLLLAMASTLRSVIPPPIKYTTKYPALQGTTKSVPFSHSPSILENFHWGHKPLVRLELNC